MRPRRNAETRSEFSASVTPTITNGVTTTRRMSSVVSVAASPDRPARRRRSHANTGHVVAASTAAQTIADMNGWRTRKTPTTRTASTTSVIV